MSPQKVVTEGSSGSRPTAAPDSTSSTADAIRAINVDRGCFAWMLGGDDGRTLSIVANHYSGTRASDGIVLTQAVNAPHAGGP